MRGKIVAYKDAGSDAFAPGVRNTRLSLDGNHVAIVCLFLIGQLYHA